MTNDELRKLAEAATPGEWSPGHLCDETSSCNCRYIFADDGRMGAIASVHVDDGTNDCPPVEEAKSNQRFIAAASPARIIALLDELDSLRAPVAVSEVEADVANSMVDAGMFSDAREAMREIAMAEFMANRPSQSDAPDLHSRLIEAEEAFYAGWKCRDDHDVLIEERVSEAFAEWRRAALTKGSKP